MSVETHYLAVFTSDKTGPQWRAWRAMSEAEQAETARRGVAAVRHQHEVGSDLGDSFKEMVAGDRALKAGGHGNTMSQFAAE